MHHEEPKAEFARLATSDIAVGYFLCARLFHAWRSISADFAGRQSDANQCYNHLDGPADAISDWYTGLFAVGVGQVSQARTAEHDRFAVIFRDRTKDFVSDDIARRITFVIKGEYGEI